MTLVMLVTLVTLAIYGLVLFTYGRVRKKIASYIAIVTCVTRVTDCHGE